MGPYGTRQSPYVLGSVHNGPAIPRMVYGAVVRGNYAPSSPYSDSALVEALRFAHRTAQPFQQLPLTRVVGRQAYRVETCCCSGEPLVTALDMLQLEAVLLSRVPHQTAEASCWSTR